MEELIKKENEIFDVLQKFIDAKLDFIVVGGYAVSAFKHRFSIDADIIIEEASLLKFIGILEKHGFRKTMSRELENLYASKFIRYEKDSATIDIMVNALACRQTGASFSHSFVAKNSLMKSIIGIEKEINVRIPIKELLIAMKIHSGRLTDFRDVASLAKGTDLDLIKKFVFIGDITKVQENLKNLYKAVKDKNFADSFKGVFIEKKFDIDLRQLERISELMP